MVYRTKEWRRSGSATGNITTKRTTNTDVTVTHDPSEEVYTAGDVVGLGKELFALIVEGVVLGTGHID